MKMYKKDLLIGGAVVLIFLLVSLISPMKTSFLLSRILIMMLFGTAVNILFGHGGIIAFGQAMFLGFGSYSFVILLSKMQAPYFLALLFSVLLTILFSYLISVLVLRVQALTLGMLFMGLNLLFYNLGNYVPWLGGGVGISWACRPGFAQDDRSFLFFTLAVVAACFVLMYFILHSPFDQIIKGIRENEMRLTYLGINTRHVKQLMLVLSGMFCGIAGILYAMLNSGAYVTYLSTDISIQGLIMCLLGGMYTFWGPSIGAGVITIVTVYIASKTIYHRFVLGIILILIIYFFPGGVLGQNPDDVSGAKNFFRKLISSEKGEANERAFKNRKTD